MYYRTLAIFAWTSYSARVSFTYENGHPSLFFVDHKAPDLDKIFRIFSSRPFLSLFSLSLSFSLSLKHVLDLRNGTVGRRLGGVWKLLFLVYAEWQSNGRIHVLPRKGSRSSNSTSKSTRKLSLFIMSWHNIGIVGLHWHFHRICLGRNHQCYHYNDSSHLFQLMIHTKQK